jgi:hypothetical protein
LQLALIDRTPRDDLVEDYHGDRDLMVEEDQQITRRDCRVRRSEFPQRLCEQITDGKPNCCQHALGIAAAEVVKQYAPVI